MVKKTAAVFGGSGFLGRQIVKRLVADNWNVRVAVRHPERASFLRDLTDSGQVEVIGVNVYKEQSVTPAVTGATVVINSVGHYVAKGDATFDAIHGQGALHVARQAKLAGVERLILISGLGADIGSPSPYVRARAKGENLVQEAFDKVTILRPSVIFGPDDAFLNKLTAMVRLAPLLPLFGSGATRMQPVFVGDVAEACARLVVEQSMAGQVIELGGPGIYSYKSLLQLVQNRLDRKRPLIPVPFFIWESLATLLSLLPNPPLTRDQVILIKSDNILTGTAKSLRDLGINPTSIERVITDFFVADDAKS